MTAVKLMFQAASITIAALLLLGGPKTGSVRRQAQASLARTLCQSRLNYILITSHALRSALLRRSTLCP